MNLLTTLSNVRCSHGGDARVASPVQDASSASQGRVLVESDTHLVSGCPFVRGTMPSPCLRISWQAGAPQVLGRSQAPLTNRSLGTCWSAEGVQQGVALIAGTQSTVSAG
jgi:hypothetical protein